MTADVVSQMIEQLRWQDVADVAVLTFVLYRIYLSIRGTVAIQIVLGILMLAGAAVLASMVGMYLTVYLLQALGAVAALVIVVVFRDEIRRTLGRANPVRWWQERQGGGNGSALATTAQVIAESAFVLARRRTGALLVFPGTDPIDEHVTGGSVIDAVPSPELLESVFQPQSPIHDGAALVQDGRISRAGCFLPVSQSSSLPDYLGSRHRAAVGLAESCDATVVVVSEERAQVSLVVGGTIEVAASPEVLARRLVEVGPGATQVVQGNGGAPRRRLRDMAALLVIFSLVLGAWWIVVGQPGTVVTRTVQIELRNVPEELEADPPRPDRVLVHLRGSRTRLDAPGAGVQAWIDLEGAQAGRRYHRVRASAGAGLEITEVVPASVPVRLRPRK